MGVLNMDLINPDLKHKFYNNFRPKNVLYKEKFASVSVNFNR